MHQQTDTAQDQVLGGDRPTRGGSQGDPSFYFFFRRGFIVVLSCFFVIFLPFLVLQMAEPSAGPALASSSNRPSVFFRRRQPADRRNHLICGIASKCVRAALRWWVSLNLMGGVPQVAVTRDLCREAIAQAQVCEYTDLWHAEFRLTHHPRFWAYPSSPLGP